MDENKIKRLAGFSVIKVDEFLEVTSKEMMDMFREALSSEDAYERYRKLSRALDKYAKREEL